MITTDIDL